jgi:hypothetical protein
MGTSRGELKARLLAEYEVVVERALARSGKTDELTLSQIEVIALEVGAKVEEQVSQCLVEEGRTAVVPGPKCAACRAEMHNKGQKKRNVQTRSGTMHLERAYYYCEHCRRGVFPPG